MKKTVNESIRLLKKTHVFRNGHQVSDFYIKTHIIIRMSSYDELEMMHVSQDFVKFMLFSLSCVVLTIIYFML